MQNKKLKLYGILVLIAFIVLAVVYFIPSRTAITENPAANLSASLETVSAQEIYPLFLCPCCGQPLDKNNICCGAAQEMIDYIDSLVVQGLFEADVIVKTVEKYGITSIIESKRAEITDVLAKRNPDLFPTGKLSFDEAVGKQAPEFNLESIDGKTIKLSDYKGKNVILFFNEGSMCYPACWDQIAELGKDERFNGEEIIAFSIVADSKSEWEEIVKKTPGYSNAKILFDTTRAVSLAYDVLSLKSSMHPGSFPGHTYFVIDKEGIVRYTFDDPNMAIRNDMLISELSKLGG